MWDAGIRRSDVIVRCCVGVCVCVCVAVCVLVCWYVAVWDVGIRRDKM